MRALSRTCVLSLLVMAPALFARAESPRVTLVKTPDGGIQPQAVVDAKGTIHLVYPKGAPAGADVFYRRARAGAVDFAGPIRVNSEPSGAVAVGTIRGAQLALGRAGRVHVAWNGSSQARPANPI